MPKINIPQSKKQNTKIPTGVISQKKSYDNDFGRLAFSKVCDKHCLLAEWQRLELERLIDCFKKIEGLTWKQIKNDPGLNYESHSHIAIPRPSTLPPMHLWTL